MKYNLILLLSLISTISFAQSTETMRLDRPGKSIGAFTVGKNILQFQQGIGYQKYMNIFNSHQPTFLDRYSENVIRYGISNRFEISTLIDYSFTTYKNESNGNLPVNYNSFRKIGIGGRYNILDGSNSGLAWGLQGRLDMNSVFFNEFPKISITTSLAKDLKYFTLLANLGFNQSDMHPDHIRYNLQLRIPIRDKIGLMMESYGNYAVSWYANDIFYPYFNAGFWYYLNEDIQLDIQGGYGHAEFFDEYSFTDWYLETGISWRLNFND